MAPPEESLSVSWQAYVDQRFHQQQRAVEVALEQVNVALARAEALQVERVESVRHETKNALEAATIAISKSDAAAEKRFTSFDELRHTLNQQESMFVSREVASSQFAMLKDAIVGLDALKANERLQIERIESLRRETAALQVSNATAISKSDVASEKRFESVNEFRGQLADQAARFIPREVVEAQTIEFRNQLASLASRLDLAAGGQATSQRTITVGLTVVGVIISIIVLLANNVF